MSTIAAVVAHEPEDGKFNWRHQQIASPRPPKEGEMLVRIVSAGICHTDMFISSLPGGTLDLVYPKVLGHEGAGYVLETGPGVTVAQKGDPVLLSYNFCDACDLCKQGDMTYCENFHPLNSLGETDTFKSEDGTIAAGKFFGQSSFAATTIVDERTVVNVKDLIKSKEELVQCAPMGCGLMTGVGTVFKHLLPRDIMIVAGLGAVGMGVVFAAKHVECKAVIAVDRVDSRLQLAKEFGATHLYNTTDKDPKDFVSDVRALVDGQRISLAIDTTAVIPLIQNLTACLGKRGRTIQIGVPQLKDEVVLPMADFFFQNKSYEISYLGDSRAADLLPKMIKWYQEGQFPIDRISKYYTLDQIDEAMEDMKRRIIKPILVFE